MHLYHDRTNQLYQDGTIQSQHNGTIQPGTGTSKPRVLQLSAPVPVSILPQPRNPTTLSTTCRESLQHLVTTQEQQPEINIQTALTGYFKSPK